MLGRVGTKKETFLSGLIETFPVSKLSRKGTGIYIK
jgi:hypothetical protein